MFLPCWRLRGLPGAARPRLLDTFERSPWTLRALFFSCCSWQGHWGPGPARTARLAPPSRSCPLLRLAATWRQMEIGSSTYSTRVSLAPPTPPTQSFSGYRCVGWKGLAKWEQRACEAAGPASRTDITAAAHPLPPLTCFIPPLAQGGPGCASLFGNFFELGPELVDENLDLQPNPGKPPVVPLGSRWRLGQTRACRSSEACCSTMEAGALLCRRMLMQTAVKPIHCRILGAPLRAAVHRSAGGRRLQRARCASLQKDKNAPVGVD